MPRRRFLGLGSAVVAGAYVSAHIGNALASPARNGTADLYVAPDGDDSNPGTKKAPFLTIDRARQAVRAKIADGMTADVVVMLRGGAYYLQSPVTFDEHDSGTDGHSVIYTNYPGEVPRIVGGTRLTGWTRAPGFPGNVYQVTLPEVASGSWSFDTLYANGHLQTKARYPNEGYLRVATAGPNSLKQFTYEQGTLPAWTNLDGAQVWIWASPNNNVTWADVVPIASIDAATRTITLTDNTILNIGPGNRYFIQGVKAELNRPGEFYLDKTAGILYYWPDGAINHQEIVAPRVHNIFQLTGSSPTAPVHDIIIDGLNFNCSDFTGNFVDGRPVWNQPAPTYRKGAIYLTNATGNTVRRCTIGNVGLCGVVLDAMAQQNVISSNEIAHFGYFGVLMIGSKVGTLDSAGAQVYDNKANHVSNNYLHHGGLLVGHGAGILLNQSGENEISHNLIREMPRYGIAIKGDGPVVGSVIGTTTITWANHWDYRTSRSNLIAFNDVSHVNQDSTDTGGITLNNPGRDNHVDNNRVHDIHVPADIGDLNPGSSFGIYLDGNSDYTTVTNNVVYEIGDAIDKSPIFVSSTYQLIENNIFVATFGSGGAVTDYAYGGTVRPMNHVYRRNILFAKGGVSPNVWAARTVARGALYSFHANPGFGFGNSWISTDDTVSESDYNLFFDASGLYLMDGISAQHWPYNPDPDDTYTNWKTLFGNKYDQHSAVGDPLFVDPAAGNFRLQSGSPALGLGFQPIDQDSIGLLPEYQVIGRPRPS